MRVGVLDADDLVARRVKDDERLAQVPDGLLEAVSCDVLEELPLDAEGPPADRDLRLPRGLDLGGAFAQELPHMVRLGGCRDRRDRGRLRHAGGRGKDGGTAQAVPDEELRCRVVLAQEIGRGDEIAEVRGEIGVGELALARAETGEIETQHGKAALGEAACDARRGEDVLRAGETMGEERISARRRRRHLEEGRETLAAAALEIDALGSSCHAPLHLRATGGRS